MNVYRQKYEDWFNTLTEDERKNETARMNTSKNKPKNQGSVPASSSTTSISPSKGANTMKFIQPQPQIPLQPPIQQVGTQPLQQPINVTIQPMGQTQLMGAQLLPQQIQIQPPSINQQQVMPVVSGASAAPVQIQALPVTGQAQLQPTNQPSQMVRDPERLKEEILTREPVEPARSPKQLFIKEWLAMPKHKKKKPDDAKKAWKDMERKEKKVWADKLEPQRQKYIELYTIFVRGLDKEELELYTELKAKRDQEEETKRQNESSDSEDSDSSDSESESDSDSESE